MATGLPAATSLRFNLEGAISPTFAKGDPDTVATVTRQALTPAELRASQRVSFALRMRNFEELNTRISRGEILSVKEMTEKYFPLPETWRRVASWVAAQGLLVEEA
ncbi:MAG: hypothetical protein JWQ62_1033, partial [Lacunisphaera sp.]|nr:hypothetical protein [Lacunisphaera sp.]